MTNCIAVGLGGFIGATLRYLIGLIPVCETTLFPVKTFFINIAGCIAIAFVDLGNDISGLVHISQIAQKRIESPAEVLKAGQEVNVKVLKVENGKISLSMKALEEVASEEEDTSGEEVVSYKDEGDATTGLGALLAGLKL